MAGGKKLPTLEALTMASSAIQRGAAGVDMGRNIFQSEAPARNDECDSARSSRGHASTGRLRAI